MSTPTTVVADRYRLVKMIGAGGMGVVWEAWDERLHRSVALKLLRTRPELTDEERESATRRAMREARLTAGLHHPHAVPVFDVVEHEGQPGLVMQLIDSTPLSTLLQEHGVFTPAETARVGAQVGSALAAAHHRRIVHRDVKPANILIREDGSAMISDFGIAYALGDANLTATGLMYGTPAYLAPEVARGEPSSFASDVFSLGSTLFAMLEGAPPFGTEANAIAMLHRVASGDLPTPTRAGPLEPLLLDMLSPEPKWRPDMKRVVAELTELERDLDAEPPAETGEADGASPTIPIAGAAATIPDAEPRAPTERLDEAPSAPTGPTERMTAAPLFPWMTDSPPAPEPATAPEPDRPGRHRRRTGVLIGALAAVGLLVLAGVLLLSSLQQPDGGTAAGPTDEPSATTEPSAPESTPPDTEAEAPPPAEPSPEPTPEPEPQTGEERAIAMLTDYYSIVPGDLDRAWTMMTEDYQVNHVGGRDAFEDFWGDVTSVTISDVSAEAPDQAQATLTYTFDDGRVVREVTAYRLVDEGGTLKIAATTVLSSTSA